MYTMYLLISLILSILIVLSLLLSQSYSNHKKSMDTVSLVAAEQYIKEENLGKYLVARDTFKHCINESKNQYQNKLKKELEEHLDDPKGFWKCIKNLGRKEQKSSGISPNEWFSHFKNLLSQESTADKGFQEFVNKKLEANDNECDMHIDVDAAESYVLNREIGIEEVIKTVKALPDGKSPGEEGMIYEVFKAGLTEFGVCIVHIFNRIMHSGEFPEAFCVPYIKKDQQGIQIIIEAFHCYLV